MKTVALVQARMGSSRLPGKVMRRVGGIPMIELVLRRLSRTTQIDEIIVATSDDPNNRPLIAHVQSLGFGVETGSETDVLDRFHRAAKARGADVVVRITADCPLVDPEIVDRMVRDYKALGVDYLSNTAPPTFPDGLDVEVFSFAALDRASRETNSAYDREHVTPYLRGEGFRTAGITNAQDLSHLRWTVDEATDLDVIRKVYDQFLPDIHFTWTDVLDLQDTKPELFAGNAAIARNEGATMGRGSTILGYGHPNLNAAARPLMDAGMLPVYSAVRDASRREVVATVRPQ